MPNSPTRTSYDEDMVSLDDIMSQLDSPAFDAPHKSSSKPRSRPTSGGYSKAGRPLPPPPIVGRRNSRSSSASRLSRKSSTRSVHSVSSVSSSSTPQAVASEWDGAPKPRSWDSDEGAEPSTPQPGSSSGDGWGVQPSSPSLSSPRRFSPRSPRNERTPVEDFAFLYDEPPRHANSIDFSPSPRPASLRSNSSRLSSSIHSARLREDSERAASELRFRSSQDALRLARPGSVQSGRPSLRSRNSDNSTTFPAVGGSASFDPERDSLAETRSVTSTHSAPSAPSPLSLYNMNQPAWPTGPGSETGSTGTGSHSNGGMPRSETNRDRDRDRGSIKPRPRELREWSQPCWVWQKEKSTSGGMLSKAPLIRDVPAAMKRKMGKRDSSQLLSPESLPSFDDKASSKGLREKASRGAFSFGSSSSFNSSFNPATKQGSWKPVTGVLRDDGYFRVFNEDTVIVHSFHLPSIMRTDVQTVDQSLFGRPNVVAIHRRNHPPSTPASGSFSKQPSPNNPAAVNARIPEESLYLCMPSIVAMQAWIVMAHCFAKPEFLAGSPKLGFSPPERHGAATTSWSTDEEEGDNDNCEEIDTHCRIYRSISLSINEGRGVGEAGTEITRPTSKALDRRPEPDHYSMPSSETFGSLSDLTPIKGSPASAPHRLHRGGDTQSDGSQGLDTFCEVLLDGEVVARTSVRKGTTSPFWSETFVFRDLPPLLDPMFIKIYQHHKNSRPTFLGSCIVRIADQPRSDVTVDWWPIKPAVYDIRGKQTDTVGELNISVKVDEEVVLPSTQYSGMLQLLTNDADAELSMALAHELPSELEEVATILLRIHQAEGMLIPRILRLIELEMDGNLKSASILFRGNSLLTKSIELYLRLVGAEYLELSLGEPIRRLCATRVEIEIDPSKMKSGVKEKELSSNVHELHQWTTAVWNAIYVAREKCPNDVRVIFAHIQKRVSSKYGGDQKKMRSTSVSAFIFLRFFVPAVLNPKLFNLISSPPDPKSQRTLTLIAKTLQGLANFSSFGQKEPWMFAMNPFVQDNTSAFVDFIEHISTPSPIVRYEWTSPHAAPYIAPYRLRNSLPQHVRDGVPLLPHLLDLPRDLGLLASHVVRGTIDRERERDRGMSSGSSASMASRSSRSARFDDFAERCVEVHEEAQRRGGGLINLLPVAFKESTRNRARSATVRSPTTRMSADLPATPRKPVADDADYDDVHLHIRIPSSSSAESPMGSVSRRSHRAFTVSSIPPRNGSLVPAVASLVDDGTASSLGLDVFKLRDAPPPQVDESDSSDYTDGEFADDAELEYVFPPRPPGAKDGPVQVVQETLTTVESTGSDDIGELDDVQAPIAKGAPLFTMPSGVSVPMAVEGSTSTQASDGGSTTSTVSIGPIELGLARLVTMGRRGSAPGVDEVTESKRKGLLSRMGRKNSRVAVP